MPDFLKNLLASSLIRSAGLALLRHIATAAGMSFISWLAAHNVDPTAAQGFVGYLVGAVVTGAGILWSQIDVQNVGTKMVAASAISFDAGVTHAQIEGEQAQATADKARADTVRTAIASADAKEANSSVDDVLARMRAGKT